MSIKTASLFKEETRLCCYPGGTTLTTGYIVRKRRRIMSMWTLGMTCSIIVFVHYANEVSSWYGPMVSRLFDVVYNRAAAFDDCPPGSYAYCLITRKCIRQDQRCDRYQDCPDDLDEINCECLPKEFACYEGRCISELFRCDGIQDCPHGDDESEFHCGRCPVGFFKCKGSSMECQNANQLCDGVEQCSHGEDEENCVNFKKKNELVLRSSYVTDAYVCYSSWKASYASHFCKLASRGSPIKSFPLVKNTVDQLYSLAFTSNTKFTLTQSKRCPKNQIVGLICQQEECGKRMIPGNYFGSYMINGMEAARGEFPWQVHLQCGLYTCGASLIGPQWLLTAAHCVYEIADKRLFAASEILVHLGSTILRDANWVVHAVEKIISHHNYLLSDYNDMALIKLKIPVLYTQYIQPICLPHDKFVEEDYLYCLSTGFGKTYRDRGSAVLLKQRMKQRDISHGAKIMCIGTAGGNKYPNACMGDSGGPFACRSKHEDRWTLIGVHSFVKFNPIDVDDSKSSSMCQNTFVQLVYPFMKWIKSHCDIAGY